jgi:hypothetical protein
MVLGMLPRMAFQAKGKAPENQLFSVGTCPL